MGIFRPYKSCIVLPGASSCCLCGAMTSPGWPNSRTIRMDSNPVAESQLGTRLSMTWHIQPAHTMLLQCRLVAGNGKKPQPDQCQDHKNHSKTTRWPSVLVSGFNIFICLNQPHCYSNFFSAKSATGAWLHMNMELHLVVWLFPQPFGKSWVRSKHPSCSPTIAMAFAPQVILWKCSQP